MLGEHHKRQADQEGRHRHNAHCYTEVTASERAPRSRPPWHRSVASARLVTQLSGDGHDLRRANALVTSPPGGASPSRYSGESHHPSRKQAQQAQRHFECAASVSPDFVAPDELDSAPGPARALAGDTVLPEDLRPSKFAPIAGLRVGYQRRHPHDRRGSWSQRRIPSRRKLWARGPVAVSPREVSVGACVVTLPGHSLGMAA